VPTFILNEFFHDDKPMTYEEYTRKEIIDNAFFSDDDQNSSGIDCRENPAQPLCISADSLADESIGFSNGKGWHWKMTEIWHEPIDFGEHLENPDPATGETVGTSDTAPIPPFPYWDIEGPTTETEPIGGHFFDQLANFDVQQNALAVPTVGRRRFFR